MNQSLSRREALTLGVGLLTVLPRRGHSELPPAPQVPASDQNRMARAPVEGGERFEPVLGRLFTTPYDNDPFIVGVESKLKCTCGCLHNVYECRSVDFTCSLWPQHHADIVQQATAGWTGDEIIAFHLENYGQEYLMAPAARGFNLVGYLLPGSLILTVGVLLVVHLRRTTRLAVASSPQGEMTGSMADSGLNDEDSKLLEEELQSLSDW